MPKSNLELHLEAAMPVDFERYSGEMDVLFRVLAGTLGTPPQRNTLLRVLKANRTPKNLAVKMTRNIDGPNNTAVVNRLTFS